MDHLESTGAAQALRNRFEKGAPILGICLGMQLALEHSDEDGGVDGIGLLSGSVHLLTEGRSLDWMGHGRTVGDAFYFAHSYAATCPDSVATSEGVTVAVERGAFLAYNSTPKRAVGRFGLSRAMLSPV